MRYPADIYEQADNELRIRRLSALNELDRRLAHLREDHPDIRSRQLRIADIGVKLGHALIADNQKASGRLLTELKATQAAITGALCAAGLPEDYLEAPYTCKNCEDTGLYKGQYCDCRRQVLNRLAYKLLSNISNADGCSFASFDLGYYAPARRKIMGKLLEACRRYAADFSRKSPNLLFMGPPGLGKTHLSLAIAREVMAGGKLVMYASAVRMFERLADSALGVEREDEYRGLIYGCDLLVIDDLGSEMLTRIVKSEVYNLINTRINEHRPTIISTNLTLGQIEGIYDARILSRLAGEYAPNSFEGKDIRIQKKARVYNGEEERREAAGAHQLARSG